MIDYLTLDSVNTVIGNTTWANGDEAMAVMLANSWLSSQPLPSFVVVPTNVILAGVKIAQAYANGEMFQGKKEATVIEKSVKADSVEVSKKFAEGEIVTGKNETIALQLIAPYLVKTKVRQARVGRA